MDHSISSEPIKVGLIGSGFGGRVILPCLQAVPNIRVVAWASRDPEKIRATASQYGVSQIVSSLEEMLKLKDVELICIATPPALHRPMAEKALRAGKHVLCEKPLARDASEAREMVQSAEKSGRLALVDHQLRFHPNMRKIKSVLDEGALGTVRHVEILYQTSARASAEIPWDWWSDAEQGGGELNALGSHFVDLLRWWFGEIQSVQGFLKTFIPSRRIIAEAQKKLPVTADDYTHFQMAFRQGASASVTLSAISWEGPRLEIKIAAEKGALTLHDFDSLHLYREEGPPKDLSETDPLRTEPIIGLNSWRTSLVRLARHLAEVLNQSRPNGCATFHDAYKTQQVLDAIRESHEGNNRISL